MHKKSKLTGLFLIAFLQSISVYCQDYKTNTSTDPPKESNKFDWSKIYTGGGLGMQFGQFVYINVSPIIGYRITDQLSAGVSLSYQYFSNNNLPEFSSHTYGGGLFGQYAFTQNFFAHLEYQLLNSEFIQVDQNNFIFDRFRKTVSYIWVGGGFRQPIGGNSFFVMTVLYNINESVYSIYPNPIYRIGVNIGL